MATLADECLVCLLDVLPINRDTSDNSDGVFACQTCSKVFHAPCLREWAKTANAPEFRCPACNCPQDSALVAEAPRCFCGKTQFAALSPTEKQTNQCANSCARVRSIRGLKLADAAADYSECACPHPCSAKCHPGPCEPCSRFKSRTCHCGRFSYQSKCGVFESKRACDAVCGKKLNCGLHTCQKQCHSGPCNDCQESVSCTCFCSATTRKETCGSSQMVSDNGKLVQKFTCNNVCNKLLSCGNHSCSKKCHKGACATCSKSPSLVNSCPCGKTTVMRQQRTSCLDPIPTCDSICDKTLSCGHRCLQKCHNSDEPCVCIGKKTIPCECGKHREEVACTDLVDGDSVRTTFKCNSICKTLKNCGKHECSTRCCIMKGDSASHECTLTCNRMLSCGNHRCQAHCHLGKCGRCLEASFDEISCNCGEARLIPPIPCGTNLSITCSKKCPLPPGPCGHPRDHPCHSGPCPPCQKPVSVTCFGSHQTRSFPCSQVVSETGERVMEGFSCNLPCGVGLSGCHHSCTVPCHVHDERTEEAVCKLECLLPVKKCPRGHLCRLGCKHVGECSGSESGDGSNGYCTTAVQVTCTCGALVSVSTVCHQIDAYKLVVVGTGVGSRRFEVRVDCVGSVVPRCVETRRKKSILASFAGRSGELVDSGRSKLARRFVQRSGSFNAIWFVDLPNTSDLGRREVAGFVRSKVKGEIEFLNVSATGGTKLPEYPKDVLADMKARGKVGDVSSLVEKAFGGNMERRDQIVWFMGRILTSVEVKALVGGREAWVIPLFVGEQEASQIPAPIPMSSNIQSEEAVDEVDNESAIIAPTAPENLFEVLEDKEAVIDDDELEVDVPLDGAVIADAQELAKKTKKKKKKSKAVEKEEAVVEKALAKIEDPEVQAKAANLCGFEKCKEKLGALAQYCKYCDRKYCMTHRYPEVHSPICAAELKKGAQTSFKNDAKLAAAIGKGQTQGGKSGSLAKEREDAKKRLAEKIKAARK